MCLSRPPSMTSAFNWTHWSRDKMVAILHPTFSNAFSWMKTISLRFKFNWHLFPSFQLTITAIGSDNGLALNMRQAIIWTNDGTGYRRICGTCLSSGANPEYSDHACSRLFHAPTRTTSNGCLVLHRTVHALWNLYGNPYRKKKQSSDEGIPR